MATPLSLQLGHDSSLTTGQELLIEQHRLDTNAGKQLS
jgi:hypothetical protein